MNPQTKDNISCAVIGYGSWATAIVKILLESQQKVGWHIRNQQVIDHLISDGTNPKYLSDVQFDTSKLDISSDINKVISEAQIIILAVPSAFLSTTLEPLTVSLKDKFIISAIKGIIPQQLETVAEYVNRKYEVEFDRIGIISGPCHAEEVALERLSYLTMVCKSIDTAKSMAERFKAPYIKVSPSTDIYGVEYAAVLKNIYAIAVGIAVGLGYGDNFLAVLISNSAMEMDRFLELTYPAKRNVNASVYLGDLLVTCYSQFSRNRRFGAMIGKGYSVKSTQIEMNMIAEGYYGAECINEINQRYNIDMPIANAIYDILYKNAQASSKMRNLTNELI